MTTLICKMCGGSIELTGESHGRCDSCGCEVTLPKIDDSKRADMYNRGNHFRTIGDFDKAYSAYEHIIADDQSDAEAHWCLMLCRYGVEYVKDARTGDYKPTVSRMSFDPVLEDPDYLAALNSSDEYTKEIYRREARKIESIQKQYLEISRREQPYDVFICFKAEEPTGGRTKASEMGQDIYERLTEKGLNVFFSRITLEDKLTEAYEPYIFAALNSAKVMLVVADKPEQLQARWVKNEWTRYLSMMDKDRSKHILPVFRDMGPYDFPAEIPMVQGLDMSKIGAMQDLIRGVCKITGHLQEPRAAAPTTPHGPTANSMLFRAKQAVEDGEFKEAKRFLEEVLNREPDNGEAYYYYFLADHEIDDIGSRAATFDISWCEERYFKRAMQYADGAVKSKLQSFQEISLLVQKLNNASALCDEKKFRAARELLSEVETAAGSQNFEAVSKRHQIVKRIYEEKHAEHMKTEEALREKNAVLKEYKTEIGDPSTYLRRTMQKRYPKEYEKYNKLDKSCNKIINWTYDDGIGIITLVCSFIVATAGFSLSNSGSGGGNSGFIPMSILAFYVALSYLVLDEFIGVVPVAVAGFVTTLVVSMIEESIGIPSFLYFIWGLVGAAMLAYAAFRTICSVLYNISFERSWNYRKRVIVPLEEKLRKEANDKWRSKVGEKNLMELKGSD